MEQRVIRMRRAEVDCLEENRFLCGQGDAVFARACSIARLRPLYGARDRSIIRCPVPPPGKKARAPEVEGARAKSRRSLELPRAALQVNG